MIRLVEESHSAKLVALCRRVPLEGSLILVSHVCSLADWRCATLWLGEAENTTPQYALSRTGEFYRLAIPEEEIDRIDQEELLAFLSLQPKLELQGASALLQRLNLSLHKEAYSSVSMQRAIPASFLEEEEADAAEFKKIRPAQSLFALYDMIAESYAYYRSYVVRDDWMASLATQRRKACTQIYELVQDGKPVCSGVLTSTADSPRAIISTIATLPAYRGRGFASTMVRFLCQKAAELHKPTALDCGEDALAAFYARLGFTPLSHWTNLSEHSPCIK